MINDDNGDEDDYDRTDYDYDDNGEAMLIAIAITMSNVVGHQSASLKTRPNVCIALVIMMKKRMMLMILTSNIIVNCCLTKCAILFSTSRLQK